MTKSKFSFLGICLLWLLSLGALLISYLTLGAILQFFGLEIVKTNLSDAELLIVIVFYVPLTVISFSQIIIQGNIIYIDLPNSTITFKNYFTRKKRIYSLSEFDGYIDTLVKSPRGDFRVIYLVKNDKLTNKLSGRFYSNLEEVEKGLNRLKYLGFHKYNLIWSLKIFFNRKALE